MDYALVSYSQWAEKASPTHKDAKGSRDPMAVRSLWVGVTAKHGHSAWIQRHKRREQQCVVEAYRVKRDRDRTAVLYSDAD